MISQRKIAAVLRASAAVLLLAAVPAMQAVAAEGRPTGETTAPKSGKRIFSYYLPRTELSAEVAQRLTKCPVDSAPPEIETTITVAPRRDADPHGLVLLDASANVFAKRTVKLEINPDGTLASFNSQAEGQGLPILKSVAKLAFQFMTGVHAADGSGRVTAVTPKGFGCNDATKASFTAIKLLSDDIKKLEALVIDGNGNASVTAMLTDLRTKRATLRESLILKASGELLPSRMIGAPETVDAGSLHAFVEPVDYSEWFDNIPPNDGDQSMPTGYFGFQVQVEPEGMILAAQSSGFLSVPSVATPDLVYRRGIPAAVTVRPCASPRNPIRNSDGVHVGYDKCQEDTASKPAKLASFAGDVVLPQLSNNYVIRTGRGGLFGSRQATAKFDANGVPSALEYGSTSASADLAGLVDTAGEGIGTLRDAELSKLKRQIELEEARQKLDELRGGTTADDE